MLLNSTPLSSQAACSHLAFRVNDTDGERHGIEPAGRINAMLAQDMLHAVWKPAQQECFGFRGLRSRDLGV